MQPTAVGPRGKIVLKHRKQLLPEFAVDLKGLGKDPSTVITHLISAKKENEFMRKILRFEEESDKEDEIWLENRHPGKLHCKVFFFPPEKLTQLFLLREVKPYPDCNTTNWGGVGGEGGGILLH